MVHYKVCPSRDIPLEWPALYSCFFHGSYHPMVLTGAHVCLIKAAVGSQGSFPSRDIVSSTGSNSYEGDKDRNTQDHATPSEGPGMKGKYKYYRQTNDSKFYPGYMRLVNDLARTTSFMTGHFYKHLRLLFPWSNDRESAIWLGRFAIVTLLFANTEHVDKNDLISSVATLFQDEFARLLANKSLSDEGRAEVLTASQFVDDFGTSIPTTCCYQFIPRKNNTTPPLLCM